MTGQRALRLADDQAEVMRAILKSDKPLMYVSALAGTGKSVVLGLLMDLMMSADRHVIVLVPSRVLRDETVITHCQEAGLTEHDGGFVRVEGYREHLGGYADEAHS